MEEGSGATIDLDWNTLSPDLAERVVAAMNVRLASMTNRPSYIGPILVSSLDFGTNPPEVELVDVRDICPDFLEDDEDEEVNEETPLNTNNFREMEDDFEWVSRREGASARYAQAHSDAGGYPTPYSFLPPHIRPGSSSSAEFLLRPPGMPNTWERRRPPMGIWSSYMSMPNLATTSGMTFPETQHASDDSRGKSRNELNDEGAEINSMLSFPNSDSPEPPLATTQDTPIKKPPPPDPSAQPSAQLHFRIMFESNLRLTLSTSLQINYPSPLFMALPVKLSIIGLIFQGEVVVACEGDRKRIHLCILDDQDPFGPAAIRNSSSSQEVNSTPDGQENPSLSIPDIAAPLRPRPESPTAPIGVRLLPSIFIESEIGQQDKHVLKNVNRVERFVQDVIRKTVEEELVFPNFMTIVLDGGH